MSRCAPAIDAGICADSRVEAFVVQQLAHSFKIAWLGIKQHLCAQMAKLMRGKHDASPPL